MENKFDAPQFIARGVKHYGLEKQHERGICYRELTKDAGGKCKRTESTFETTPAALGAEIKAGAVQIIMPSRSHIEAQKQRQFQQQFKAPAMIARDQKTYGFEGQNKGTIFYLELKKQGDTFRRTTTRIETTPTDLARDIRSGAVKVVMPNREYSALKEQKAAQRQQQEMNAKKESVDIKPVQVQPLTARERKEVKEAMQKGRLEDNRHSTILFKRFENQLKSVPDRVNGTTLSQHDKLKLLVGDYSDHQNTRLTVQPDKTVQMGANVLTTANAQYSEKQLADQKPAKQAGQALSL